MKLLRKNIFPQLESLLFFWFHSSTYVDIRMSNVLHATRKVHAPHGYPELARESLLVLLLLAVVAGRRGSEHAQVFSHVLLEVLRIGRRFARPPEDGAHLPDQKCVPTSARMESSRKLQGCCRLAARAALADLAAGSNCVFG